MDLLKKNKMPFGKNKGKSIKNLSKKYIRSLRKNPNFKNDPDLMEKINNFHKLSSNSSGGSRSRRRSRRKNNRSVKRSKDIKIYYLYMKGCQPCKNFNPEWEKIKQEFPNHTLKKIERENKITQQFINDLTNFEGFPSIVVMKNNKKQLYQGPMKSNNIIRFLKKSNKD